MIYHFSDCELDTQLFTLKRAGKTLRMRPKVFQVLSYLVEHRDRVVEKQELAEQLWPGQFISDSPLESTIRAVRHALGDNGRAQRLIETLYGRGYRFVAKIDHVIEAAKTAREPRPDDTIYPARREVVLAEPLGAGTRMLAETMRVDARHGSAFSTCQPP